MKAFKLSFLFLSLSFLTACTSHSDRDTSDMGLSAESSSGSNSNAGVITAGEWNDLNNWTFLQNLLGDSGNYNSMPAYWELFTNNRISLSLSNNNAPAHNIEVILERNGNPIWATKTDLFGQAELWISPFQKEIGIDTSHLAFRINGQLINQSVRLFEQGLNEVAITATLNQTAQVDIAFIVDATGSMADELEFLKDDLKDVIETVENADNTLDIYTSAIFYRDQGDEYVLRKSDFNEDINATMQFINQQSASGGGDYPEALHTALSAAVNQLQWSGEAKARIAFLLLDAPPHYRDDVKLSLQNSIEEAAKKGIKLIPIAASGVNKETEFLLRFAAVLTNGTYVFITNDSGVGNEHIDPSVGSYQIEKLNALLIRLIEKYSI